MSQCKAEQASGVGKLFCLQEESHRGGHQFADAMTRPMVTDDDAAEWLQDAMAQLGTVDPYDLRRGSKREAQRMRRLLAERERTLGLLRESVDDQLLRDEVPTGDKRLRCDMCSVVLTYWRVDDGGTHEKPHNDGCLIPKWEALLKEAGRGHG